MSELITLANPYAWMKNPKHRPILTRIRAKGWLKWFKKDQFRLEYEYVTLTGDWDNAIIRGLLMAGDRPIMVEA